MISGPSDVPSLLAVSSGSWRAGDEPAAFARWAAELAEDGVEALQVREKHLDDRALFELSSAAVRHAGRRLAVLVNGRADIAMAAGAQGVHLPARGVPTQAIRRRFPRLLVGRSTHEAAEIAAAATDGAHYVTFGPVRPTPSKARFGPAQGVAALAAAVASAPDLPVLALGGIGCDDLESVAATGCHGVAGIRVFTDPASRRRLVARARELWPRGGSP